tara:strand:+ start:403 stop:774 length:372 start_codon:yes stop_codon:yes gene_type:complete
MPEDIYFFDSYAIIEIIKGNENYKKYTKSIVLTTKLNLFEVFYVLVRDVGEKEANYFIDKYYPSIIDFDKEIIKKSAKFRLKYKKRDLSMTDCIGYFLSKKWKVKFLTGDKEFEDMENVEFVK